MCVWNILFNLKKVLQNKILSEKNIGIWKFILINLFHCKNFIHYANSILVFGKDGEMQTEVIVQRSCGAECTRHPDCIE